MEAVRRPPPNPRAQPVTSEYVTVVSVGASPERQQSETPSAAPVADPSGFVTVLKIGDTPAATTADDDYCVEQVLVYRLPGERLGFGLKFEGGTKAAEFVKRLFIQSCAPDSPASRVRGTWGPLTEGDEVLAIDNAAVTSMTRIDCVRCLKDSNVVIKLQVRHKLSPEAPLVISAEKKRSAPPPPPVPPRKGPRKKNASVPVPQPPKGFSDRAESPSPVPQARNSINGAVVHPPDAEVYLDLFSQEYEQDQYCLSESDDTGSSISTVIDRFGSFPTTTTSSFAGSMPSTPTAVQRRIQHTNPFDVEHSAGEELLFERLVSLQAKENQVTLQPPANFQDAPLSYADEDVRVVEAGVEKLRRKRPPPPPPPRTKHLQPHQPEEQNVKPVEANNNDYDREDANEKVLPRLVDFLPKSTKSDNDGDDADINDAHDANEANNANDASKMFIEQEQLRHTDAFFLRTLDDDGYDDDEDAFVYGWSSGQPLATIGEADNEDESPESLQDAEQRSDEELAPAEEDSSQSSDEVDMNATSDEQEHQKAPEPAPRSTLKAPAVTDAEEQALEKMDTRQPPDGHEFPDYHREAQPAPVKPAMLPRRNAPTLRGAKEQPKTNVKDMIAMFSHAEEQPPPLPPQDKAVTVTMTATATPTATATVTHPVKEKLPNFDYDSTPMKRGSMSDLTMDTVATTHLHKRSQSLVDISSTASDRWTQILDQRRRGLSKLKGLIIPEHPDVAQTMIDLPEIKSSVESSLEFSPAPITTKAPHHHHTRNNSTPSLNLTSALWSADAEVECAKYSPAFKRKTLQVYAVATKITSKETASSSDEESRLPSADAPKSLESITSPTRSDCSFEYASMGSIGSSPSTKKVAKSEDESDNDSAVSSSQSSYISRQSPPASPNHLYDRRMLKAQSVEAINRKNILASAKCRSGKDLNGSPLLIQRKFDEPEVPAPVKLEEETVTAEKEEVITSSQNGVSEDTPTKMPELVNPVKPSPKLDDRLVTKFLSSRNNAKSASVTDLRKNFENATTKAAVTSNPAKTRSRVSTTVSETISSSRPLPSKRSSLPILTTVTKIDTRQVLESTVKFWTDEGITSANVNVIALRPEIPGGSIGITLAGGTDYETKDITIHKVRNGSVAHRDGRLRKGERVLSINGKSMNAVTHAESMSILKEPVSEVIIVTTTSTSVSAPTPTTPSTPTRSSLPLQPEVVTPPSPAARVAQPDGSRVEVNVNADANGAKPIIIVKLTKDPLSTASGLGFSMEGGRGSPQGDVPLLIKKLFTGGLADKSGMLAVGDELVEIQGADVTGMPRIDAWSLMKKLPPGEVALKVRR